MQSVFLVSQLPDFEKMYRYPCHQGNEDQHIEHGSLAQETGFSSGFWDIHREYVWFGIVRKMKDIAGVIDQAGNALVGVDNYGGAVFDSPYPGIEKV